MDSPVVTQRYTPEELLAMPGGHRFELVDSQLVERNTRAESSWIAQQINRRLGNCAEAQQQGLVMGPDCGDQIFPDDPNRVRFPDGFFIRLGRLPNDRLPRGHVRIVPDFPCQVISPNDLAWEVEAKVAEDVRSRSIEFVTTRLGSALAMHSAAKRCCQVASALVEDAFPEVLKGRWPTCRSG